MKSYELLKRWNQTMQEALVKVTLSSTGIMEYNGIDPSTSETPADILSDTEVITQILNWHIVNDEEFTSLMELEIPLES